jgi:hypothetical protein
MKTLLNWMIWKGYSILIVLWVILTLILIWPKIQFTGNGSLVLKQPEPGGVNFLIIAPWGLAKSASAWADYREDTGYQTRVVLLTRDQAVSERIRAVIQEMYTDSGKPYPFYVLLIGHAHPFSSHSHTFLPTAHFSFDISQFSGYGAAPIPSDDGYTSASPNGIPDHTLPISIGRIPARTEEESFLLLARTKAYEESPPTGEGRARIELVSSNAGFGPQLDPIFDQVLNILMQELLPVEYQWHLLNGNSHSPYNYPFRAFPEELARRFDSGALAMVYIGHGQPDMICCACSLEGEAGRILHVEDVGLLQNAKTSLGIFTACSAGTYDLAGNGLSVVEAIYLAPSGPVMTYSSSAWINGELNGRLVVDIFEALLINRAGTAGEWVGRIENWSQMIHSRDFTTMFVKDMIPRFGGAYENQFLRSRSLANQELDIQHASYNLFDDPAQRIVYPQLGLEVHPNWLWQPWRGRLAFHGESKLSDGQQVTITLESLPGNAISSGDLPSEIVDRYHQANDKVLYKTTVNLGENGNFTGRIDIPNNIPGGKYLLKALVVNESSTYVAAHAVILGWLSFFEIATSAVFWWFILGILMSIKFKRTIQQRAGIGIDASFSIR